MSAYRDDLEAALQRADALERELAALRERNQRLAARAGDGDASEATTNARRLAAAIARENAEHRRREEADLDEREARVHAKAGRPVSHPLSPAEQRRAAVRYGLLAVIKIVVVLLAILAALTGRGHR